MSQLRIGCGVNFGSNLKNSEQRVNGIVKTVRKMMRGQRKGERGAEKKKSMPTGSIENEIELNPRGGKGI